MRVDPGRAPTWGPPKVSWGGVGDRSVLGAERPSGRAGQTEGLQALEEAEGPDGEHESRPWGQRGGDRKDRSGPGRLWGEGERE